MNLRMMQLVIFLTLAATDVYSQASGPGCIECCNIFYSKKDQDNIRIEKVVKSAKGPIVNVSLKNKNVDPHILVCLLASKFSGEKTIAIQVFDTRAAARHYVHPQEQEKPAHWMEYANARRAIFIKDEEGTGMSWFDNPTYKDDQKGTQINLCPAKR